MRDDFSSGVRSILAHRAGFRCSKPDCRAATTGPSFDFDKKICIGIAAHITAAAVGGPRFEPALIPEDRRSVTNGIWLCDNHAREIDLDTSRYTTEVLRAWKYHAETVARALLGRPISNSSIDVSIEVALIRDSTDGLWIVGETNLPDGTNLMGELRRVSSRSYYAQTKGLTNNNRLLLGPFTDNGKAIEQAWLRVVVISHFNEAWSHPSLVLDVVGKDGAFLVGKYSKPLDPDLDDTAYFVQAEFEFAAPPLLYGPPLTPEEIQASIDQVKQCAMTVEGHERASACLSGRLFMSS